MNTVLSSAVVFRSRNGWEAADMGVFLWQTNLLPILLFTGIPTALFFFLNILIINSGFDWSIQTGFIIFWWLKPFLDRYCLHVVSVRFFEPHSTFRRIFKGLGKTLRTGLFGDLLWRRFSLARSARMPILVLERLKGKQYRHRKQLLGRNGLGFGTPLTLICIGIIIALYAGELVFFGSILGQFNEEFQNPFDLPSEKPVLGSVLFFINTIIIETLYVAMGFSLYITSRVETEGWDIELLFKTCVKKIKKVHKTAVLIPALFLLFFLTGTPAWAQQETPPETNPPILLKPAPVSQEQAEILDRIHSSPEFGYEKPSEKIQFKESKVTKEKKLFKPLSFPPLRELLGIILRFLLVAALITALCFAAIYAYRNRTRLFPGSTGGKNSIEINYYAGDSRLLLQQAEELHRKGKIREAWALCFKAFVSVFAKLWFFPFPAEATEYEALALVRKNAANSGIDGFELFIKHWIAFAYGGTKPPVESFGNALASCRLLLENQEESV